MEKGERRTFWVSNNLDAIIEEVRKKLGLSKSAFYRYAVVRLLEEMSILSTKAKEVTAVNGQLNKKGDSALE